MSIKTNERGHWVDFTEYLLGDNNRLSIRAKGMSMYPTLREGDHCVLEKCQPEELKAGDIVAFRRGDQLILHRFLSRQNSSGEWIYYLRGDNMEKHDAPFRESQFVARLVSFERKGKVVQANSRYMQYRKFVDEYLHNTSTGFYRTKAMVKPALRYMRSTSKDIRKNLKRLLQGNRKIFRINALIAVLKGVVPLGMIVSIKFLVDFISREEVASGSENLIFYGLLALTAVLFLSSGLLQQLGSYFGEKMSQSVTRKVYDELHQKHIRLYLLDFENSEKLDKMHRAVQEASYRPVRMLNSALGFIKTIAGGVLLLGLFVSIRWYLTLILLLAVLPEALFRLVYVRRLHKLKASQMNIEREKHYYNRVITGYPFAKEIRLFDFSNYFIRLFGQKQEQVFSERLKLTRFETRFTLLTQLFAVILIFGSLGIVAGLKMSGVMSIGTVVLFFFAFQRGYSLFNEFFRSVAGLFEDNTFLNDYLAFLNTADTSADQLTAPKPFSLNRDIRFENLSFRYESSERDAIRGVNMYIPAGKTVALVGENGAGKTTLIKLLCGFFKPTEGNILFDGVGLDELDQKELLANITAVFQDFALYQVAAMDNILLGNYHGTPDIERAKKAADTAGIHKVLEDLPNGYQTRLGHLFNESEELSIGQWQKMALARAFYRDAPLLLMDEPSSALDANSERQMIESLKQLSENKTTLIVSHRLSTVQWADEIYLLDDGQITEIGTHEELLELKGKYYELFHSMKD